MYERLKANVALNGVDVEMHMVAVSDTDGTASLYDAEQDVFCGASLERTSAGTSDRRAREVPTVRLDTHCRGHGIESIDLLKLDIEGHEAAALSGMGAVLEHSRPSMLVEVLGESAARRLTVLLEPLEYEFYRIHEGRGIRRVERLDVHEGHDRNYLTVQAGVLSEAGLGAQQLGLQAR
jgi:FkbM family methyltransferase